MRVTAQLQQGAHSPKPVNGSATTSPLKDSPDNMQNSSSNLSSLTKAKKRERTDHSFEHSKRERSMRTDDGESAQLRTESTVKLEIAKIAGRGGLFDSDAVERLVQLMQSEKSERKLDLAGRSILAGIVAATDKHDCLSQFVQLKGLVVFNDWLQEVHKGKLRDAGNLKEGDKSVDDFLLVLLRALEKIPVNLNTLQMCNIGKSVNHLRTHKNSEIQKKSRSLVDTWKKRVEAEMNINDAKSASSQAVSWSGKSRHDGSQGGNRHHSSLKSTSGKLIQGDSTPKSASAYPGDTRSTLSPTSTAANFKDIQPRISPNVASSETPQAVVREEKSSSSSQSHTDSQCSSDHGKNVPSGKDDARSSTAGSRNSNKTTGSGYKHQKSANGLQGAGSSVVHREDAPKRGTSVARISVAEKVSDNVNAIDASVHAGNNHKLIVKIPSRGCVAAQNINGSLVEDSSCRNSRATSPDLVEKHDPYDGSLRKKPDPHQLNEVDGSSMTVHHKTSNDPRKLPNVSQVACSPTRNEVKPRKALDSSFNSMNALVESCVKFSEANASMSAGDDVGMNLLASVATGEICQSTISPVDSPPYKNSVAAENSCSSRYANQKQLHGDDLIHQQSQLTNIADSDKCNIVAGVVKVNDGETSKQSSCSGEILHQNEGCLKSNGKLDEQVGGASLPMSSSCTASRSLGDGATEFLSGKSVDVGDESHNQLPVSSQGLINSSADEDKVKNACLNEESEGTARRDTLLCSSSNVDDEKHNFCQGLQSSNSLEHHSLAVALPPQSLSTNEKTEMVSSTDQELAAEILNEVKSENNTDAVDLREASEMKENRRLDQENDPSTLCQKQEEPGLSGADKGQDTSCRDESVENKEALVNQSGSSVTQISSSALTPQEVEANLSTQRSKIVAAVGQKREDGGSTGKAAVSPGTGRSYIDTKLGFDLNEGFSMEDGKSDEPVLSGSAMCVASVCSVGSLQIPVSLASGGLPASVTVASAAKGAFVPPDDLLRNKRELGWKGMAATSAFRPAEPRKVLEVPVGPGMSTLPDAPACKQLRLPLDIDLNVADEGTLLDIGCQSSFPEFNFRNKHELTSGGLDLDLNKVDEALDVGQHSANSGKRLEIITPVKASSSSIFPNGEANCRRDFDLNDGPVTEEMPAEQTSFNQHDCSNIPPQIPLGPMINSNDTGNCFAWYPPGTSYSISMTPSALSDREAFPVVGIGSGPQRLVSCPTPSLSFNPDAYRGSVLSSAPAMPFHSTSFPYPVFPFGTSFPLPTSALSSGGSSGFMDPATGGRISAIPSQLVGTAAAVPFQYPHAYVVSRPSADVGNNGVVESNQKWGKQGLDLNFGPVAVDAEGRDESLPIVSRQLSAVSSQSLVEEQVSMYNMAGGLLKRKEPEGGRTMDKLNFKQSPWR